MTKSPSKSEKTSPWKSEEIQHIALPLPAFQYQHTPEEGDVDQDRSMVGRDNLLSDLGSVLTNTRQSRGSYLLAGFRGAGKTTLINTALDIYNGVREHLAWLPGSPQDPFVRPSDFRALLAKGRIAVKYRDPKPRREPFGIPLTTRAGRFFWISLRHLLINSLAIILRHPGHHTAALSQTVRSTYKRICHPLVHVHVNLATEGALDARTVLYNTAFLLHRRLREVRRSPARVILSSMLAVFLAVTALSFLDVLLGVLIPGLFGTLGALLRSFSTLLLGADKTNAAIQVLHAGVLSNLGMIFAIGAPLLVAYFLWSRWLRTPLRIERRLADLLRRGRRTEESDQGLDAGAGFRFTRHFTTPPLDAHRIEAELLGVLRECRRVWPGFGRPDVVFVFDELDKISGTRNYSGDLDRRRQADAADNDGAFPTWTTREVYKRKERVDELLSTIKNFITEGQARFFFIAGREMLDSYQSERGNSSSLYESLFNRVFEVPSLLTDPAPKFRERLSELTEAFVCRRLLTPPVATFVWYQFERCRTTNLLPKEESATRARGTIQYKPYRLRTVYHWMCARGVPAAEARRSVFMLRHFIHFLTLHSWGNCKRLNSLFEHFIKPTEIADSDTQETLDKLWGDQAGPNTMVLQFGRMDQQRIMLSSNLFVLVKHHLGRQFSSQTDKLAVSLFAALQYFVKFHRFPFARSHLERMDEALSIHRSPELNTAIDTLLNLVLRSHVRLIRNGLSRYRFMQGFEQEVRYIARISDIESAAFNFSLDSTAGVKRHYQELLRHIEKRSDKGADGRPLGASTIADIHITLGDLFTQEESLDQAAVHFQEAADILLPRVADDPRNPDELAKVLLPCVEALLKLGDVNEHRQRYERAAAAYTLAQSVAAKVLDWKPSPGAGRVGGAPSHVQDASARGDSKWDILKQPLWALRYLSLKRSPFPWSECCEPDPRPYYRCKDEWSATDPVYHYRAGQLAFFYGQHWSACRDFAKAIEYSNNARIGEDNERAAYLVGYAELDLAENLLVAFMRQQHISIRDAVRGRRHSDPTFVQDFAKIANGYVEKLCVLIATMAGVQSEDELRGRVSEPGAPGIVSDETIGELCRRIECVSLEDAKNLEALDLKLVFGVMAQVARRFDRHGLSLHATVAYLKLISLWTCLLECLPLSILEEKKIAPSYSYKKAMTAIQDADLWLRPIQDAAMRNVQAIDANAFSETWYRIWESDVPHWRKPYTDSSCECVKPLAALCNMEKLDADPGERSSKVMDRLVQSLSKVPIPPDEGPDDVEPLSLYYPWLYQKLLFVNVWQRTVHLRLTTNRHQDANMHTVLPPVRAMVPSSIRSLLYAHWIRGRTLTLSVIKYLSNPASKDTVTEDDIYDLASRAAHNLWRAHYYIRQMCGNDQDVMFPSPASVIYSLWRLIDALLKRELRKAAERVVRERAPRARWACILCSVELELRSYAFAEQIVRKRGKGCDCSQEEMDRLVRKQIMKWNRVFAIRAVRESKSQKAKRADAGPPKVSGSEIDEELLKKDKYPDWGADRASYAKAVRTVRDQLSKGSDPATPGQYFDYRFVTERVLTYLRDVEQLGDLSSRARAAVLKGKFFLSDDYEDPRFHLDWSMIQMLAPTAALVREHVIAERRKVFASEDDG